MLLTSQLLTKIGLIVLTVFLLIFLLTYLLIKKIHGLAFNRRYDKTFLHFFTHNDFEGLEVEEIEFKNPHLKTMDVIRGIGH